MGFKIKIEEMFPRSLEWSKSPSIVEAVFSLFGGGTGEQGEQSIKLEKGMGPLLIQAALHFDCV